VYEVRHVIATSLRIKFEASYHLGVIPSDWKIAETVPIYNKGSRAELNNYRPVSMTSVTCKLMESIIRDHVLNYFMRNRLFSDRQYGFIKGRSTTLQLLRILDDWTNSIDSGDQIDCIYRVAPKK